MRSSGLRSFQRRSSWSSILHASDHHPDQTATSPLELGGLLLGAHALELALVDRVWDLDPLLADHLVQIATPATAPLRLVSSCAALATGRIGLGLDQARELVERGERGGELQLQLSRVDALGLRDHQAPVRELDLDLERLIGFA